MVVRSFEGDGPEKQERRLIIREQTKTNRSWDMPTPSRSSRLRGLFLENRAAKSSSGNFEIAAYGCDGGDVYRLRQTAK